MQAWSINFDTALRSNVFWLPGNDLPAGRWDTQPPAGTPLRFEGAEANPLQNLSNSFRLGLAPPDAALCKADLHAQCPDLVVA